jgi:TRAP-type C4-dicarboxylate transport system substrate-binding protein
MNIKKFACCVALATLIPGFAAAEEIILKVAHFAPPTAPGHARMIGAWCEKIVTQSQGKMKCQIYPAMQLGGTPPQLLTQVRDGVADLVWTLPGYTPGRFPVSEVFELPFITTTQEATSRALWDFVEKNAVKEYTGLKPVALWVPGPYALHTRDTAVKTLGDLKGRKIRTPSRLGTKLLEALGAIPVGMPVPQVPESLSKGVIDGTILPWEVVPAFKVQELTSYSAEFGGDHAMSTTTMMFVMNKKKYDSLPADLKKVIDNNSGREESAWFTSQLKLGDDAGRQATIKHGNNVYQIPADEMAKWQAAAKPVAEGWITDISSKGFNGKALHDEAVALINKYSAK